MQTDEIAVLLAAVERGDREAREALFAALYGELHGLARRELGRSGSGAGLGVTTLLHEAYLDIAGRTQSSFPDRARFMSYASRVMRGLIIDFARSGQAQKRGGGFEITSPATDVVENVASPRELTEVSDALDELAQADPSLAELVDLKFFCGFSFAEIGAMVGASERTVQRRWEEARIYLYRRIRLSRVP